MLDLLTCLRTSVWVKLTPWQLPDNILLKLLLTKLAKYCKKNMFLKWKTRKQIDIVATSQLHCTSTLLHAVQCWPSWPSKMKWSSWPSKKHKTCLDQYWKSPLFKTSFPRFFAQSQLIPVWTESYLFWTVVRYIWRSLFRRTLQSNIFISEDIHFNHSNIKWIQTRRNNQS